MMWKSLENYTGKKKEISFFERNIYLYNRITAMQIKVKSTGSKFNENGSKLAISFIPEKCCFF